MSNLTIHIGCSIIIARSATKVMKCTGAHLHFSRLTSKDCGENIRKRKSRKNKILRGFLKIFQALEFAVLITLTELYKPD